MVQFRLFEIEFIPFTMGHLANPQGSIESLNFQKTSHLQLSSPSKSLRLAQLSDTPSNFDALHELQSISRIGQM
jgi:hypothetical protein